MLDFSRKSVLIILLMVMMVVGALLPMAVRASWDGAGTDTDNFEGSFPSALWDTNTGLVRSSTHAHGGSYSAYGEFAEYGFGITTFSTTPTNVKVGAYIWVDSGYLSSSGYEYLIGIKDSTYWNGIYARGLSGGQVRLFEQHVDHTVCWETNNDIGTMPPDGWHYLEYERIQGTSVKVWVDGSLIFTSTNVYNSANTGATIGYITGVYNMTPQGHPNGRVWWDDYYVMDSVSTTWYIDSSSGANGDIDPEGLIPVDEGDGQHFDINPDGGYDIDDVLVNSVSVGAVTEYNFVNVTANATISATFVPSALPVWYIDSSSGAHGDIDPEGLIAVTEGNNQHFDINPDAGYAVDDVLVDSVSQGDIIEYDYINVTANSTISATFVLVHNITASAGIGGTIDPSGVIVVIDGNDQRFNITASVGYAIVDVVVDGVNHLGAVDHYIFYNVLADHSIIATFVYLTPPDVIALRPEYIPAGSNIIGGGPSIDKTVVTSAGWCYTVGVKPYNPNIVGYRVIVINWVAPDGITNGYSEVSLSQGIIGWIGSGPAWTVTGLAVVAYDATSVIVSCGVWRGAGSEIVVPVVWIYTAGEQSYPMAPDANEYVHSTGFTQLIGAYSYTPTVTGVRGLAGVEYWRLIYATDYFGTLRVSTIRFRPAKMPTYEVIVSTLTDDNGSSPSYFAGSFEDPSLRGVYYLATTAIEGDSCKSSYWVCDINSTVPSLYWVRDGFVFSDHLSPYLTSEYKFLGGGIDIPNHIIYYTTAYVTGLDIGYTEYVIRQERFLFNYDVGFYPYVINNDCLYNSTQDSRSFAYVSDVGGWFNAIDATATDYRTFTLYVANSTTWMKKSLLIPDWTDFYGQNIGGFNETSSYPVAPHWMTATDNYCGRVVIPYGVGTPLYGESAVIDHARNPTEALSGSLVYYEHYTPTPTAPPSTVYDLFFVQTVTPPDVLRRVTTPYNFDYTITDNFGVPYAGHLFNVTITKPSGSSSSNFTADASGRFNFTDTAIVTDAGFDWAIEIIGDNVSGGINDHTFIIHWFPNVVLTAITVAPVGGPYVGTAYTYHTYVTVDGVPFVGTVSLIKDASYPAVATDVTADGHAYMTYTQPIAGIHTFRAEVTIDLYTYPTATITQNFTIFVPPPPPPWWQNLPLILAFIVSIIPVFILLLTTTGIGYLALNTIHGAILGFNLGVGIGIAISIIPLYFVAVCLIVDVGAFYLIGIGVDE
jgi:hypothetical protein